jgi:hypothetical protein
MSEERPLYGLMAVFGDADALSAAVRRLRAAGLVEIEAYTPFPVDGLADELGFAVGGLGRWVVGGGLVGGAGGLFMQWYANVVSHPINVGGRPLAAWPAFALPAFELAVLGAVLAVVGRMLWRMRLPRLNHPVFEPESFGLGRSDGFFLVVEARDPRFEPTVTWRLLAETAPRTIEEVRP